MRQLNQLGPLTFGRRTIEGGERQVITTPGADNAVTRPVRGIMKGDFAIDYSLDQPPCGTGR